MSKKRIGVFGGTFDPPHIGHQILAMEASAQLKLRQILWVLTPDPPHKIGKKITHIDIRKQMVISAIDDDPIFVFSSLDMDRPGPHYVLDTMNLFRKKFQKHDLVFLMGGDSLHDLPQWHKPQEFINACDKIGVMRRPGEKIDLCDLQKKMPGIINKIEFVDAPLLEISSNQIRQLVKKRKPFRYYVPNDVYKIIMDNQLYR